MSREGRTAIENGIWMCYTHGKLIDTDEVRYSIEKLKGWKLLAEKRAQGFIQAGVSAKLQTSTELIVNSISLTGRGNENELIGNALFDSCIAEIWGASLADAIRDTCIEICRNSITHGNATSVSMKIEGHCIRLSDDGTDFNPWLFNSSDMGRGGALAISHLKSKFSHQLLLEHYRKNGNNETAIGLIYSQEQICSLTPCHIKVNFREISSTTHRLQIPQECNEVYLLMPKYVTISDIYGVRLFLTRVNENRPVVFVLSHASALAKSTIQEAFPGSRIVIESS